MATIPVTGNAVIPTVTGGNASTNSAATGQAVAAHATGITSIQGDDGKGAAPQTGPLTPLGSGVADPQGVPLTSDQKTQINGLAQSISSGASTEAIQSRWANFIADMNAGPTGGCIDVNALVQEVLRQSYSEQTSDLEFYAQKVQFFNKLKQAIRAQVTNLRQQDSALVGAKDPSTGKPYTDTNLTPCNISANNYANEPDLNSGTPEPAITDTIHCTNRALLEGAISDLEDQLNSVGDDAQLANVDLQDTLQKQQATLQLVSNISKMLYDTATAVIRKIGS